jgi:hypothetical protein
MESGALRIGAPKVIGHDGVVDWKTIRLELGRTADFPAGSVTRAYLVRLPVTDNDEIDEVAVLGNPTRATVRRFWPCEPDRVGHVVRTDCGWAFRCGCSEQPDATLVAKPLKLGEDVFVTEGNGPQVPFRVASIRSLRRR